MATSGIIVSQLSDHLPYFVCIDIDSKVKPNFPKYVYVKQNTEASINCSKTAISNAAIHDKLNSQTDANPNNNYDILHNTMCEIFKRTLSPYFRNSPLLHTTVRLHLTWRLLKFMQWLARKQYLLHRRPRQIR